MFSFSALFVALFISIVGADYFTNPASFITGSDGENSKTNDLTYTFTFGQKVQVTWFSPALDDVFISLSLGYWDPSSNGATLGAFIST
jgi:hypothetical protein